MPNIEMYGFYRGNVDDEQSNNILWTIVQVVERLGLSNDAVITRVVSDSSYGKNFYKFRDTDNQVLVKGKDTAFIRVCSTDPEEIQRIIAGLKEAKIGIDIEYLVLAGFTPAEEMK